MEIIELLELLRPLIETVGVSFNGFVEFILAVGAARLVMKPLMLAVQEFVKATPTIDDDSWLEKMMSSKGYKTFSIVVDYLLSIKLPKKE